MTELYHFSLVLNLLARLTTRDSRWPPDGSKPGLHGTDTTSPRLGATNNRVCFYHVEITKSTHVPDDSALPNRHHGTHYQHTECLLITVNYILPQEWHPMDLCHGPESRKTGQ
jgi:hypothetical protein